MHRFSLRHNFLCNFYHIQVFLSLAMAGNKAYLNFKVKDELINCTIMVSIFYFTIFIVTAIIINNRKAINLGQGS